MKGRRRFVTVAIVAVSLWVTGCSKASSNAGQAPNSPTQTSVNQQDANTAAPNGAPVNTATSTNGSGATVEPLTIPAGTPVTVRLQQSLSSASAVPGERFEAVLDEPIVIENRVAVPTGATVTGHVTSVHHSGRLRHPGELGLTLDSVTVGDQQVQLVTSSIVARGGSHKKRNLSWIGGGTGGGALIGALAAGGKGALIGSGVGAVAGTTTAFITGKKDVGFGVERRLRFRLRTDITLAA